MTLVFIASFWDGVKVSAAHLRWKLRSGDNVYELGRKLQKAKLLLSLGNREGNTLERLRRHGNNKMSSIAANTRRTLGDQISPQLLGTAVIHHLADM